ncbi:MAG: DUF86 domain-containing protein [Bacteroidales bacterium]|nr:DUF86 domain-containing protein [Bacteroidales bacterium]
MREPVRDAERLQHILDAINTIESSRKIHSTDEAAKDPIIYYGFIKHVEIIGEAVYMLSKEFKEAHPEMDWTSIEGMRHVLVHGYYHIKPNQLWDTIDLDLPELKPYIEKYLSEFSD